METSVSLLAVKIKQRELTVYGRSKDNGYVKTWHRY